MKQQHVTVIGLGYVGFPLFSALSRHQELVVYGYDNNPDVVAKHRKKIRRDQNRAHRIVTTDPAECLPHSDVIIICVPTPITQTRKPNFKALTECCRLIAQHLKKGQVIVVESTIHPGVCETMLLPLLEASGLKGGIDFHLSHCPERINPGDAVWNITNIPRNVGSLTPLGAKKTAAFYRKYVTPQVSELATLKEAESAKLLENVFRDVNIALVNEMAMAFDRLGIDAVNVIEAASTKPFGFLAHYPGCGVGGDCIATDPYYYMEVLKQHGFKPALVATARNINRTMPQYLLSKVEKHYPRLRQVKLAVLGVTYKPDVEDTRNSPALELIAELKRRRLSFVSYDPYVTAEKAVTSLTAALAYADVVLLCTAHSTLRKQLSPRILRQHNIQLVADGRNALDKKGIEKQGITYEGVGR